MTTLNTARETDLGPVPSRRTLHDRLMETRKLSLTLAAPLSPEDQTVQANDDASPTKWHLAHTTWFFETFVLQPHLPGYRIYDARFNFCFNSYYEAQGARQPRSQRGLMTRPSAAEVAGYRAHVDVGLAALGAGGWADDPAVATLLELGLNHEQQHQELLLTDILSLFAASPLRPAYREGRPLRAQRAARPLGWLRFPESIVEIGHPGPGFCFDNEGPRHKALVHPFQLADRLVTNAEWLDFMADDGYGRAGLWLSDGWSTVRREGWTAPLYWENRDGQWQQMTLSGLQTVDPAAPVCHISYFEADAFARWAGRRLPTEFEWEHAAAGIPLPPAPSGVAALHPTPAPAGGGLAQMFGDIWQWTQSAYAPYPGYRPAEGAIGEYNGKFMCSQQVLRGSSCATPDGHARQTYRNFFYPHQRWQFCGLRLADDV